ncbi:MAG: hypothetical protein ABS79_05710 [Planctomycetes bacterium SCN 63-9]|nr:MAG: hypothetical protein ABS79_05710 [Planctomycetes bacterium SCN 63-9]
MLCWTLPRLNPNQRIILGLIALAASITTFFLLNRAERKRWVVPTRMMADRIRGLRNQPPSATLEPPAPEFLAIARSVEELREQFREKYRFRKLISRSWGEDDTPRAIPGLENTYSPESGEFNLAHSSDYSTVDMVNRLDPVHFIWIESSIAEQEFLGWTLAELRGKSFLDIVHQDDRNAALETLRQAIERGESLGRIVRILTASAEPKHIELNVGTRYGPDKTISHLRCHLTDVTEKVAAERELRVRTLELTRANEELLRINHELQELKDGYSDLYQNAPAMYFSLNAAEAIIECNRTLLTTLEKTRQEIINQPYERLLAEPSRDGFRSPREKFLHENAVEWQTPWRKSNGEIIEVWISASLVRDPNNQIVHAQCVAQDVTTRRRLEAELERKNESLGRANADLSQKNRELDDFVYVVSHDLQEPLRTLIAFSDFLLKDYGERFDDEGREYVNYLIDASRRMRAMILAMLNLSRAGKVIGDFVPVEVHDLISVVRTDLAELIRAKGAEIRIVTPLPVVWGDWNRLTQLFTNLLVNGLKFNQNASPRVEVGTVDPSEDSGLGGNSKTSDDIDDGFVTIFIRDNGIGIDPEFHETIFQLFRRLHTQDEYEGTGAGLAIGSKIVHAHGGRIWVESSPKAGATFYVQLRRCPSQILGKDQVMVPVPLTVALEGRVDESHSV